ncbi:carboxypeptidase-like regulatory domain-containing protein [Flavobacterium sp. LaA7.5]|nr:carboxypeptidase-like regulatory domain-containing protein [Flavobacterium salilacus subsp. altitudinum]
MNKFIAIFLLLLSITAHSQIKGKVISSDGQPIPFVNITVENTYTGTTANENGEYELNIRKTGSYTLLFQSIGYKTKKASVTITAFPYALNVTLQDETYQLDEVVISNKENPANAIIRSAIASKKENSAKTGKFEADFYSKGLFRVKDVPKKIMGIKVEDEEESILDSTGSGIIYLSETVSKITFEQPNNLKERIIASKISGNDNGFSYNTALGTSYSFYDNYVKFGINLVSPLADNAFNYYRFSFEGSFFDENETQINKIKVIPRRDKEPVVEGYIYIVENSWAISAVDFDIKGYRVQQPIMETLNLKQNFSYNTNNRIWAKNSQTFDFKAGLLGITFTGKFTHVYTNYVFHDSFDKGTFGKEVVYIEEDSNKKDSLYWNEMRPVPLTEEEVTDYVKKDSIQTLHTSQTYLDSIDKKNNKFGVFDVIGGYTYRNSFKKWRFSYDGLLGLSNFGFNTVQGWNFNTNLSFSKYDEDTGRSTYLGANFDYGIAEDRLRVLGRYTHRFNRINNATLYLSGGNKAEQYNETEPISKLVNTVSTLFFKDNYMKLYDNTFAKAQYQQEVITGLTMLATTEYTRRRALTNNTDYVLIKDSDSYTSNNPLAPETDVPAFENHHLMKASIVASMRFGQKYITRPDGKIPVGGRNYPSLSVMYQKGFAASESNYEYDFLAGRITYNSTLGNKGNFGINVKGGKFFNAEDIAFIDYKHFNGNQTHVGNGQSYLNVFNLLPYYTHSTNDQYLELHAEHNFKGYIMNKIPLLNLLQWNLVLGYHQISTPDYKPYSEFTAGFDNIGLGKFKMLRVDYVRSYQNGFQADGIIFGLKFLDILD